jgi:putative hydrolase of HD superfamily
MDFLETAEGLKKLLRHSWLSDGRQESVAEHTWRMALMALALESELEHKVDLGHTLEMILSSTNMPAEDHVHISHSSFDLELRAKEMGLQGTRRYSLNLGYSYWERFYVTGVLEK